LVVEAGGYAVSGFFEYKMSPVVASMRTTLSADTVGGTSLAYALYEIFEKIIINDIKNTIIFLIFAS
jgi:uncharacterized membrane protein YbhN (UPF0104 family)